MNDVKTTIAKNIATYRQAKGMTQIELAEFLNYSDKAVSKWERADSMPDISVLVEIADLFECTLDDLVHEGAPITGKTTSQQPAPRYQKGVIAAVSVLLVWLIALTTFVTLSLTLPGAPYLWLSFIYAIPVSMIVWLVFNSIWFNRRLNYLIVSILMWTVLLSLHLTLFIFHWNIWLIYLLGIPGQLIILLWSAIVRKPKK